MYSELHCFGMVEIKYTNGGEVQNENKFVVPFGGDER